MVENNYYCKEKFKFYVYILIIRGNLEKIFINKFVMCLNIYGLRINSVIMKVIIFGKNVSDWFWICIIVINIVIIIIIMI